MRRLTSALAAGLIAVSAFAGTAAPAQAQTRELIQLFNGPIGNTNCDVLRNALTSTRMVNQNTTRSQLVFSLNAFVGENSRMGLVPASTVDAVANRALECGIVKPDPQLNLDQIFAGSSQLSSRAGLPDIRTLVPPMPTLPTLPRVR